MAPGRTAKGSPYCASSQSWDPADYVADTARHALVAEHLAKDDLAGAITTAFRLPKLDPYTYHAIVSVSLEQVQLVVSLGDKNGLHTWYYDPTPPPPSDDDAAAGPAQAQAQPQTAATNASADPPRRKPPPALPPPPRADVDVYLSIFDPKTQTANVLKTFLLNAKKNSLRAAIAAYLLEKRYLHPALPALQVPRANKQHPPPPNPYLDFLSWACRNLEWAGPCAASAVLKSSHHVLPVFMHHFGCVCPSHEALSILAAVAAGRDVWDVGSGNGYWAFMLRAYGASVRPVDNAQSAWRANWVADTEIVDGVEFLRRHPPAAHAAAVLLLVYPIVGGAIAGGEPGAFTRTLVDAYQGDTVAVVGTQNRNGYTGFKDMSMDEYMAREKPEWTKIVQIALPSFPAKDEALFVFQRGERAPPKEAALEENKEKDSGSKTDA